MPPAPAKKPAQVPVKQQQPYGYYCRDCGVSSPGSTCSRPWCGKPTIKI